MENLTYKEQHSLQARQERSATLRERHPELIPIIIEPRKFNDGIPLIQKSQFLASTYLKVNDIRAKIEKQLQSTTIYLFLNQPHLVRSSKLLKGDEDIKKLYDAERDEDGFLYLTYTNHETTGSDL